MNMNSMMEQMMNKMMEQMMEKMMESMMNSMMNSMGISSAEATEEPKTTKKQPMTLAEIQALPDYKPNIKVRDYSDLEFVFPTQNTVCFNMDVDSNIWQWTDMVAREKFGCTGVYKRDGQFRWKFNSKADAINFVHNFEIKTMFTDLEVTAINKWKADKAAKRAKNQLKKYNASYPQDAVEVTK